MNLPGPHHPCWTRLTAPQALGFVPKQLALQLLFTRLGHESLSIPEKAQALHTFFVKYEKILSQEIEQLRALRLI